MKTSLIFSLISGYALIANAILVNGPTAMMVILSGCCKERIIKNTNNYIYTFGNSLPSLNLA